MKNVMKFCSGLIFTVMSVFLISAISYNIAYKKISEEYAQKTLSAEQSSSLEVQETVNAAAPNQNNEIQWSNDDENIDIEYYIVKISGDKLDVYICRSGAEEFMYDIDISGKDLSNEEKDMLKNGIKLYSKGDLTGFIENYTS